MPILAKSLPASWHRAMLPPWWCGFALCLFLPMSTLAFLATGPHGAGVALAWTLPVWLLILGDHFGPDERRLVPATTPRGFFDGLLYALVVLQMLNILGLGYLVASLTWTTGAEAGTSLVNLLALRILMGTNSCCAAIAPAHELIHRRQRWQRWLGRVLLVTVGYDHFYVAHRLGHHARLGSGEDPSTAEIGEGYGAFCRRSCLSQWRIAWRYEPHAVQRGVAVELALLACFGWAFGPLGAFMLMYQAVVAVRLLEAVNYFQHYGLTVESGRAGATAWRTDSAVSLFLFLGLSRHADHHRRPAVPYPALRVLEDEGPVLPYGYLGMALWVKNRCGDYRRWAAGRLG